MPQLNQAPLALGLLAAVCACASAPLPPTVPAPRPDASPVAPAPPPKAQQPKPRPAWAQRPWPWTDLDRLEVEIISRGHRILDDRRDDWDMSLAVSWTFTATADGGIRISQQVPGAWRGKLGPAELKGGSARYLGLASAILISADRHVVAVEGSDREEPKGSGSAIELPPFDAKFIAREWDRILEPLHLLSLAEGEPFERSWQKPARFALSGDYPVAVAYRTVGQREPCAAGEPPPEGCWRFTSISQANPEDLRTGYERRTHRSDLVEATDQIVRWIVVRDSDGWLLEVGVHTRLGDRFQGRPRYGTYFLDKDLILRFRRAGATPGK